jgi:hypothetical protein
MFKADHYRKTAADCADRAAKSIGGRMAHKFRIGQIVELAENVLRTLSPGPFEVRHLVPSPDREPGDPYYRIKSATENCERVAPESELTLSVAKLT